MLGLHAHAGKARKTTTEHLGTEFGIVGMNGYYNTEIGPVALLPFVHCWVQCE